MVLLKPGYTEEEHKQFLNSDEIFQSIGEFHKAATNSNWYFARLNPNQLDQVRRDPGVKLIECERTQKQSDDDPALVPIHNAHSAYRAVGDYWVSLKPGCTIDEHKRYVGSEALSSAITGILGPEYPGYWASMDSDSELLERIRRDPAVKTVELDTWTKVGVNRG